MISMLTNLSDSSQFATSALKDSEVLNTQKTANENEVWDKLYTEKGNKQFDSFEHQRQDETAGTYHIMKDDNGNLKVAFDGVNTNDSSRSRADISSIDTVSENQKIGVADKTAKKDNIDSVEKNSPDSDDKINSEKGNDNADEKPIVVVTTSDLSAVEREIKKLKQQQQQLQQKLMSASEEQKQQIQTELDKVTKELERKDTDAYRNSHDNHRQYTLN